MGTRFAIKRYSKEILMSAKVYVVTITSWNGEHDVASVHGIYRDKEEANNYVIAANSARTSSYAPEYEVEEWDVK
jgi:hypothetical protein